VVGAVAGAVTACSPGVTYPPDPAPPKGERGKSKSQYQANAPEVLTFYRVNSYPAK
jgi:hypothetical protein